MGSFVALVVPAGTPKAVVDKISEASAKILKDPAVSKKLAGAGLVVTADPPADLGKDHQGRHRGARRADQGRRHPAGIRRDLTI